MRLIDADALYKKLLEEIHNRSMQGFGKGLMIATSCVINAPTIEPEQRWIPCSERLPAYGEDVLITTDGYCNIGHILQVYGEEQYNWYFSDWYHSPNDVIAWMPLPEPYREKQKTILTGGLDGETGRR